MRRQRAWWYSLPFGDRILLLMAIAFLAGGILGLVAAPFAVVPR